MDSPREVPPPPLMLLNLLLLMTTPLLETVINPGEYQRNLAWQPKSFKGSLLLVSKTQPIWNYAIPLRLFTYLSEYTNLPSHLTNIYLARISAGCKILKAFTDDWDREKRQGYKKIEILFSTLKSSKSGWRDKNKQK